MHKHHEHEFDCRGYRGHFGGRGRFFGRFGGPFAGGLRAAKMLASGDLQLIILALLSEKPRHGYEIIKQIEEHSSGIYTPSPGMVYPALTYLEETGYATAESEGAKKLYRITDAGTKYFNENRAAAEEVLDHLARFGRKMADFQKRFTDEENEEEAFAGDPRRAVKGEWREAKREFRELKEDLKAAIFEKMNASPEERKRIFGVLRRAIDEIRGK